MLILGAGISGLTAAYELSRKGYEVQVLEASFRAGGRNMTVRNGDRIDETGYPQVCNFDKDPDLYFNCGPARIPGHHKALLNYCKELDVELAPFINDNRNAWVQDDAMFGGKPIRAREYMTDSRGFVAELMSKSMKPEQFAAPMTKDDCRAPARIPQVPRRARPAASSTSGRATRASRSRLHDARTCSRSRSTAANCSSRNSW